MFFYGIISSVKCNGKKISFIWICVQYELQSQVSIIDRHPWRNFLESLQAQSFFCFLHLFVLLFCFFLTIEAHVKLWSECFFCIAFLKIFFCRNLIIWWSPSPKMRENIPTYNNPSHPLPYIDNWQNNTRVWSPWLQVSHKTQARSAGISSPHSVLISFWHSDIPFHFKSSCSCKYQCRDCPYFLNNSQPSCPNVHIKSHLVFFFFFILPRCS